MSEAPLARFCFDSEVVYWRGPSPFFFVPLPQDHAEALRQVARVVTYGWGMVPVDAAIGDVAFSTALFPKDETYLLPLKAAIRRRTNVTAGDRVVIDLTVNAVQR